MTKRCPRCERTLDIALFGLNKRVLDGHAAYCKECTKAINREQYIKNRERRMAEARRYRQDNAEAISERKRAQWADPAWQDSYWRQPERVQRRRVNVRRRAAEGRAADPDYDRKIRAKYHAKRLEWERQDRINDPDKYLQRARVRRANNPAAVAYAKHKYRASLKGNGSVPFTPEQWNEKVDYWGWKCWICRDPLVTGYHRDHVKPINKGGMHCLSNLRPACDSCNKSKSDKWPYQPPIGINSCMLTASL